MVTQHTSPLPQSGADPASPPASENRPPSEGLDKERLAPAVLWLVRMLFGDEGLAFLAQLCRLATEKQFSLFEASGETSHVAVITYHGTLDLVTTPGWKWGRETTLKFLQVLEALTILVRFRRAGHSEINIPLGLRTLNQAEILVNLDHCTYRNKKTRQLITHVKKQLLRSGVPNDVAAADPRVLVERPEVGLLVHELLALLKEEQVPAAKRKRIALWYASELVRRGMRDYLDASASHRSDSQPSRSPRNALSEGDVQGPESPSASSQGSASVTPSRQNRPSVSEEARTAGHIPRSESPSVPVQASHRAIVSAENRPAPLALLTQEGDSPTEESPSGSVLPAQSNERGAQMGDSVGRNAQESSGVAKNRPLADQRSDSGRALSRVETFSLEKDSQRDEFDFENTTSVAMAPSESPLSGNEGDLRAEASGYIALLDGPDYATTQYLQTREGKRLLGGYLRKLDESPALARVSLVNTLMQQHFHETTKHGPLEHAGKWFHQSFKRYADREHPMEISGEIASWASSAYPIEQIALALRRERERQERAWQEPMHRPFASCVEEHALLHEQASSEAEQKVQMNQGLPAEGGCTDEEREATPTRKEGRHGEACDVTGRESEDGRVRDRADEERVSGLGHAETSERYEVIVVETPEMGWETREAVRWWYEKLAGTPLAEECLLEILPTSSGRYVLVVTPRADATAAWMWSKGQEVRLYLESCRAASGQHKRP